MFVLVPFAGATRLTSGLSLTVKFQVSLVFQLVALSVQLSVGTILSDTLKVKFATVLVLSVMFCSGQLRRMLGLVKSNVSFQSGASIRLPSSSVQFTIQVMFPSPKPVS